MKSILGVKSRTEALEIMNTLSRFGYIRYTLDEETKEAGICRHRLGRKMLRHRMHERNSLCNRRLWLSLPSPQHHAAPCGSALYIRRIRCMAGPLVPHGLAGDRQCVFLSGACRSIRETWRRFDIGSLGTALGLGKDKGVEIFFRRMGMPSLCTVCRAPTAASFSIDCIRWIQRLRCPPAQKLNALLRKCVFAQEMRILEARTMHA